MHFTISCIATLELLHCNNPSYIHFNDEAAIKG